MTRTSVLLSTIFCLLAMGLSAQKSFFEIVSAKNLPAGVEASKNIKKMTIVRLNEQAMRNYLLHAPLEFQNNGVTLPLEIPLPNGKTETFGMVESPNLSPEIAAQNPEIKTYAGKGLNNEGYQIRLNLTSLGLSAILLNVEGDAVYFEHYSKEDPNVYFTYFTRDAVAPPAHLRGRCELGIDEDIRQIIRDHPGGDRNNTGGTLRTFRLAMAANGEFTVENGGTAASGLAAVTNYVNTINAIYRTELSIHFNLVSGTNLIYTNPATDPYSNTTGPMLDENQANVDAVIGSANYDISHALGYDVDFGSGGGLASLGVVCYPGYKAQGASVIGSGYGQVFYDQLIMHEMGHMFGMTHSYNSVIPVCTTREAATSVEPGAGATIMSYGFTCDTDDYFTSQTTGPILTFHTASYDQAETYLTGDGNCFSSTATGNDVPVVTMPSSVTIPKSTPFSLTGSASDADGGLTYSWEGTNIGLIEPDATTLANTAQPPFFRTYEPSASPTRTYPLLSAILDGSNYAKGDKLPSIGIATTHRLTVRDNNPAGGGLSYGEVTVTVDGSIGPFLVTADPAGSFAAFSTQTITWSVNGTNAATPNVKISLSTDGGQTFPIVLLASTANDGSQDVTIPNNPTTTARVKVESVGNIFFDISNVDFTITAGAAVTCPTNMTVCPNAPAFALTGGSPAGGSYSGPGVTANMFSAADAGIGMHTITYDLSGSTCTFVITVTESAPGGTTYYQDFDGDGFGNPAVSQESCSQPVGYVLDNTDCNDNSGLEKPGQLWYEDIDGDGYSTGVTLTQCLRPMGYKAASELTALSGDCNDNNPAVNPGATEICDGIDNNCNDQTDENGLTTYYQDFDGDGFGNPAVSQESCSQPVGYVLDNTDCNDNSGLEKPGQLWYADLDGDGYSSGVTLTQCLRPMGYKVASELTALSGDCNDNNPAVNPGATEICDGIDNNCNDQTDEGLLITYYQDSDGDQFGNPDVSQEACVKPEGYVADNTDCDDTNPNVNPDATEVSDGIDNNCNDEIDESGLPSGWSDYGENGIGCEGGNEASYENETFTLVSDGCYSTNFTADDAAYVKYDICGDGEIVAHVTSINPLGLGWAGITMRETEMPGSKKVALATNLGNFVRRETRSTTNGFAMPQQLFRPGSTWLKLVRTGNIFYGYASTNGINWQSVMIVHIPMNSCIQLGLFVTNYNGSTVTGTFDNVSVSGGSSTHLSTPETGVTATSLPTTDFSIFPNPANGQVYLDLSAYYGKSAQIQMLNALGQPVRMRQLGEVSSDLENFDISGLNNGTYFIQITTAEGDVVKRFLIAN